MEDVQTMLMEGTSIIEVIETIGNSDSLITGKKKFKDKGPKIYTQLTLEMKEDESLNHLKRVTKIEEVYELAQKIFDDENLHIKDSNLYIKFPKLEMTNSGGEKHTIYDMLIKMAIGAGSGERQVYTSFYGMRATCTSVEVECGYSHSHLEASNFGRFTQFCLGSSDFYILKQNVDIEPSVANWMLLLMSIENYLSWESLEGGPHIKIQNIKYPSTNVPNSQIKTEALRLVPLLPPECIDVSSFSLIDGIVFRDFVNKNSRIRKQRTTGGFTEQQEKRHEATFLERGKGMAWKNDKLFFSVIKSPIEEDNSDVTVDEDITANYIMYINNELNQFSKNYQHERNKKSKHRTYYTLGETQADNNRKSAEANRLSPSQNR